MDPYNNKYSNNMNDYDFHREGLKPTKAYNNMASPKNIPRHKATTERSKSKEKMIVTSFSKRQLAQQQPKKSPFSNAGINHNKKLSSLDSPSYKKNCHSEYYIKTAETKNQTDPLLLQDELRIKDGQIDSLAKRLAKAETTVSQLTAQNQLKSDRIDSLEREMNVILAKSLKSLEAQSLEGDLVYEVQKFRQDQRRLLKMLETTAQYEYFSKFALMDDGVEFLRHPNQSKKTALDAEQKGKRQVHFCCCNKQFIPEASFWVPQKIYSFGKDFIIDRKGQFTKSEYELLLYELNRLWREREKKIVNSLNAEKIREIQKFKRRQGSCHSLNKGPLQR